MSVRDLVASWVTWAKLSGNRDDDFADRLNHIYSVLLLIVFAMFVTAGTYVSEPIVCVYKNINPLMHKYANYICWINNTYYVPMHEDIPSAPTDKMQTEIPYYQYVPIMLLIMALLFKIPSVIWRSLSGYSGIDLNKISELTVAAQYVEDSKREGKVSEIAMAIDRWLESTRQYHWNFLVRMRQKASRLCFMLNRREGTYLVGLYLIVKLLYTANVVCQFYILDAFLGGFFSMWGIEALDNFTVQDGFRESRRFPRVTLCDFQLRQMTNVHTYTVLCVLPMNIFNEKIFLFLWFWLIIVSIVTILNFLVWISRTLFRTNRLVLVKKYLKIHSRLQTEVDKKICSKFASFLRDDGIFLIRMMQKNSNEILVAEIVTKLWDIYLEKKVVQKVMQDGERNLSNSLRTVS